MNLNQFWLLGAVVAWAGPSWSRRRRQYAGRAEGRRTHVTVNVSTAKATLDAITRGGAMN